jgi:hypothetical protein
MSPCAVQLKGQGRQLAGQGEPEGQLHSIPPNVHFVLSNHASILTIAAALFLQ